MPKKRHLLNWFSILTLTTTSSVSAQTILPELNNFEPIPQSVPTSITPQSILIPVPPPQQSQPVGTCNAFIAPAIEEVIKRYGGGWGILVERLSDGEVLYHYNADRGFIPASNMKILTTAAALQRLAPETNISANKSLKEWVEVTNLRSNNYYADTLLKRIGGGATAKQILANMGINPSGFHFADGSGLSRRNLATPRILVDTLRVMYSSPQRDLFFASLPTAGMSGTLRNRMKQTPVQGIVHAKTGTLTGVRALSGYLDHREYGTLIFSILANDSRQSGTALVRAIDEIVLILNTTSRCQ
ncbi:D-alanyl-D-alanine carboxypeptidase [Cyanobacterium aponinum UTEX 3222]|uniref:Peptidase S13 n=1 Tax=Cyanobacterium aponinum 0216 TaxID=2676140 RepID=A0A844GQX9_9CHRO|nr:D-alanyl-D-alanine carboxypeptidase [Cyanobacterium aponinum]MTF37481.1 peptidase S13 [Cyanobacterium aponinum 0216]WRL40444.1 D-alanyl-D-alanine carboxypeptidase [Cyanobacterium aponinum UTEX 3222]